MEAPIESPTTFFAMFKNKRRDTMIAPHFDTRESTLSANSWRL